MTTPLTDLFPSGGQSPWLDNLRRTWFKGTELQDFLARGVRGLTSNPSIFAKSIIETDAYDSQARELFAAGHEVEAVYWQLVVDDIKSAADALAETFNATGGLDGFVSVEVSPNLANDAEATINSAREIASSVDRPNVMIKVPATDAGLVAIEELTAAGLSINVTLIFTVKRYIEVAQAYMRGLGRCSAALSGIQSVASFFVSRTDGAVDALLEKENADEALMTRTAIAQAKVAYAEYQKLIESAEWQSLSANGANPQRLLWASTSTKKPELPDTYYVDALIGPATVNTLPDKTLVAFEEAGTVSQSLISEADKAMDLLSEVSSHGIDLDAVGLELEIAGLAGFVDSYNDGLAALESKR